MHALLAEKETTMTDDELEKQDKKEQKEEKKDLMKPTILFLKISGNRTLL